MIFDGAFSPGGFCVKRADNPTGLASTINSDSFFVSK